MISAGQERLILVFQQEVSVHLRLLSSLSLEGDCLSPCTEQRHGCRNLRKTSRVLLQRVSSPRDRGA